mmetsp:Transcript_33761/g.57353  ORF Transcript_33761/g.57353 Transcript_33761/m.57353 type:complete len:81 (-) Transcript_33761:22-264(-)
MMSNIIQWLGRGVSEDDACILVCMAMARSEVLKKREDMMVYVVRYQEEKEGYIYVQGYIFPKGILMLVRTNQNGNDDMNV